MANRPANVGAGSGLASMGDIAPSSDAAAPPPVHHDAIPRPGVPRPAVPQAGLPGPAAAPPHSAPRPEAPPRVPAGHRAARSRPRRASRVSWLPYLIVLAGAAAGMFVVWQGSRYTGRGTGLVGGSLLAAALARLVLPARYAGLLSSRRKASDVLAFAVFGAAVLGVALTLP